MKIKFPSSRIITLISFLIICALLAGVAYLQIHKGISPCPLCVLQRFALVGVGAIFLIGALFKFPKLGRTILGAIALIIAGMGGLLAARQVWLQHLPPGQAPECGASLQYLAQVLPFKELLITILHGTVECTAIGWRFLGLGLAQWSLIWFIIFSGVAISLIYRRY